MTTTIIHLYSNIHVIKIKKYLSVKDDLKTEIIG